MHPETGFTMRNVMEEIVREAIETVADRPGDSQVRRIARQKTTAWSISSFEPRDPLETMLASQCVVFDHLLHDGARDTLHGQPLETKLRARPQILAAGKMFLAHLDRFERLQGRLLAVFPTAEQTEAPPARRNAAPDTAASAEAKRRPAQVERAEQAEARASTAAAPPSGGQDRPQTESKVSPPAAGATSVAPSTGAHQDTARQAAAPAQQPAVAQSTSNSAQPGGLPPNRGAQPTPAEAQVATHFSSNPAEIIAQISASLGIPPGFGQTQRTEQSPAAPLVKEPV